MASPKIDFLILGAGDGTKLAIPMVGMPNNKA